jgi:fused signal recognition particle receptor
MFGFLRRKKSDTPNQEGIKPSEAPMAPIAPIVNSVPDLPILPPVAESTAPLVVTTTPERSGWVAKLTGGLSKTRSGITGLFNRTKIDDQLLEELEEALLLSDAGVDATEYLLKELKAQVKAQRLEHPEEVKVCLRQLVYTLLKPYEAPLDIDKASPLVMMIAGVNGAGKTTSIGKLTKHLQAHGKSVLLAAGDTFRAAAREQLAQWGSRNNVQVIAQEGGDPAAVAFDAVSAGIARKLDVVLIDTAGRLPTQLHLMDELKKIRRVLGKTTLSTDGSNAIAGVIPHERLLVLDGNTGQNMLAQVKAFHEAIDLTGLIITKLDGTAKGGALLSLAFLHRVNPIPVYFIGVGEGIDDLESFSAKEFSKALI